MLTIRRYAPWPDSPGKRANCRMFEGCHWRHQVTYSITSSARASRDGGTDKAERPGGAEIDDKLELGRAVDWYVRRLGAFEEAANEISGASIGVGHTVAIAEQATGCRNISICPHQRNCIPRRQHGELLCARTIKWAGPDNHSIRALLRERRERSVDFTRGASVEKKQPLAERAPAVFGGFLVKSTPSALFGFTSTAISAAPGMSSFSTSICLCASSTVNQLIPVTLASGRLRLADKTCIDRIDTAGEDSRYRCR